MYVRTFIDSSLKILNNEGLTEIYNELNIYCMSDSNYEGNLNHRRYGRSPPMSSREGEKGWEITNAP